MMQILGRVLCNRSIYSTFRNNKRFIIHGKRTSSKDMKIKNNNDKMVLFYKLKMQMKGAIQEYGSAKPNDNLKLAQIIEQAKKKNMPVASIKNFLEKMESRKNKTQEGVIEIRGPSGYVMLVRYFTDNFKQFEGDLNHKLKKCSGSVCGNHSIRNMFTHIGTIVAEKKNTLEQATEDAIEVGAEDVEEFEENDKKYFQFKYDPKLSSKIKNLLERRQYNVLSAIEDYVPHNVIELSEADMEAVSHIHEKVHSLEDVIVIYDNI
ncbi:translational activator of cytochrome c oxidase 1 [Odontomachus brunneus]|uniref:translational activator of cytochrome c oxidase 1 n=1 Tax=Odontomachus brunneus TaxID=486640 RepID=UPI0013F1EF0E|nr:translational activator of cytochrome c oxidase 1 [Odontomachus brunneus]